MQYIEWRLFTLCAVLLASAPQAFAFSGGVTSNNFTTPALGCNSCHSGGTAPTVALSGPTSVSPSSTNTYTLTINNPAAQQFGGLNVSAPAGTFISGGSDTQALNNPSSMRLEITHTAPKAAVSNMTTFSFQWTAPASFGSVTFTGWGNAVDHTFTNSFDKAAMNTLTVFSNVPTDTPTVTPTVTETPTPTPTSTPTPHDAVVLPVPPINVTIPKSVALTPKTVKVKVHVRNADGASEVTGDLIKLTAAPIGCPPGITVSMADFLPMSGGFDEQIAIPGGKTKTAVVQVTVHTDDVTSFNHLAPDRCKLRFTASMAGNSDPTPDNNVVDAELNMIDKNDAENLVAPPPHESVIKSIVPVTVTIPKKNPQVSVLKVVHPAVLNADIKPTAENPGDLINVTIDPPTCAWISVVALDMDGMTLGDQSNVTVKGGKMGVGKLQLQVSPGPVATMNGKSPARCTVLLTATGPTTPSDPRQANNTTSLTIDVIDKNDVP